MKQTTDASAALTGIDERRDPLVAEEAAPRDTSTNLDTAGSIAPGQRDDAAKTPPPSANAKFDRRSTRRRRGRSRRPTDRPVRTPGVASDKHGEGSQRKSGDSRLSMAATLFPIRGLENAQFTFRVLRVREPMPADTLRARRLQRMADQLWRGVLKCAVYPTTRFGFPGFLMPANVPLPAGWTATVHDVPDRHYTIEATDVVHVVHAGEALGAERELVCRMIERAVTDQLLRRRDAVWKGEYWTLFYRLRADNEDVHDVVRAFRGIRFGVTPVAGALHFAVDVRTKYIGRRALSDLLANNERELLREHLSMTRKTEDRAMFVRDNGTKKLACRYVGDPQSTIGSHEFEIDGARTTVYDYYRSRYPSIRVERSDKTVLVQDRKGGLTLAVPASRLFPVFTTEFDAIKRCSTAPTLSPGERLAVIESFLPLLTGLAYDGRPISIGADPWTGPRTVFTPPTLEFGNGVTLRPFVQSMPAITHEHFDRGVVQFGRAKLKAVDSGRPYHLEPIPDVTLLFPDTLDRGVREQFTSMLDGEIAKLTGTRIRVAHQIPYNVGPGQREGSAIMRQAERLSETRTPGVAVVVLWRNFAPAVHGALKEAFGAYHSQCVSETTVRDVVTGRAPRNPEGLLRTLALALLTEVGVMPWVIADHLHHDIHLGIDLLHGKIGYHALYGPGGRYVWSETGTALHHGHMREQIKRPEMMRRIERIVRHVASEGQPCGSLVIHRDGRWWPSERDGLRDAIDALLADFIIPADFRVTVAEIRKNHLPVRLFTQRIATDVASTRDFVNPIPGTYLELDADRALLTTTGRPGRWDVRRGGRTATALLIEVVDTFGNHSLLDVVEDVYRLTHLNWNAPDIEIALPVTIRWTDRVLRETLRRDERTATDGSERSIGGT